MWLIYPALLVAAGVAFGFGIVPAGIIFLIAFIVLLLYAMASGQSAHKTNNDPSHGTRGGPGEGLPNDTQASYQPGEDPSRTGTA